MSDLAGVTVTIDAELYVNDKTANTCLKLVEAYVNRTGADIGFHVLEDGTKEFFYEFAG